MGLTEQALIKAFSGFGVAVSARIPRKAATKEPLSFAFISFLHREDAERAAKQDNIDVQLSPTWMLPLQARVAKYGNTTDKRVPVNTTEDQWSFDFVHVT